MASSTSTIYFEESWAILSSIGLINCLIGLMIIGITSLSPIAIVPVVCSVACAIANGMCFYAFYADYSTTPTVIAGAAADVAWLVCSPSINTPLNYLLTGYNNRFKKLACLSTATSS